MNMTTFWIYEGAILCMAGLALAVQYIWQAKKWHKELYVDALTGKYSQKKFCMEAQRWLNHAPKTQKALIDFDIDNFKLINMIFGYRTGDYVLREVANILEKHLAKRGIFARKYGDIFSIMIQYSSIADIQALCDGIVTDVAQIPIHHNRLFRITVSMGIYLIKMNETNLNAMQNYAILTRQNIKKKYNIYYDFYNMNTKDNMLHNKRLIDKISMALQKHEFQPYYQPQYDAQSQKLIGAEALIRWKHPDGTVIMPGNFIPVSEIAGAIMYIDYYMFEEVCRQQHQWKKAGYTTLPISVNVSRHSLYDKEFLQNYMAILKKYELDCTDISIEITEGTLFNAIEISEKLVNDLRNLGFHVLIDDFGMGYSSISMVKRFKASALKIDKSFVDDMSEEGRKMMTYIIGIARLMHMKTVAEGVETKEQYEFLRDHDCDVIQGFYFAKPMPSYEFETLLSQMLS